MTGAPRAALATCLALAFGALCWWMLRAPHAAPTPPAGDAPLELDASASAAELHVDRPAVAPKRASVPDAASSPQGILVLLPDGRPARGVEVVEVPFDLQGIVRHRADEAGLVPAAPAERGACWVVDAPGFEYVSVDRYPDAPRLQTLHLRAARTLRGRVVGFPQGDTGKYEWRTSLWPAHVDPQVAELLRQSRRQEAVIDGGAFRIERAVSGRARLVVRCADRRGLRALDWRSVSVPPDADEVTVDLGGGAFHDPFADVEVRVHFPLVEPVGAFRLRFERAEGSSVPEVEGERAAGEPTVVLSVPAVPVGVYRAIVTTGGGQYLSPIVDVARTALVELEVREWTSLVVDATEWPAGRTDAAVCIAGRPVATVQPGQPARVRNLAAGGHEVTVVAAGVAGGPVNVDLGAGETRRLAIALREVHKVRFGVFPMAPTRGEARFEAEDGASTTVPIPSRQRWVQVSLPPGRYLATALFEGGRASTRIDVVDRAVEATVTLPDAGR